MHVSVARESDLEDIAALVNSAFRGDSSRAGWTTEADMVGGQRTDADMLRADLAARPGAVLLTMRDAPGGALLGERVARAEEPRRVVPRHVHGSPGHAVPSARPPAR